MSSAADYIRARIAECDQEKIALDGKISGLYEALHAIENQERRIEQQQESEQQDG